jgi:uncharacterized protein YwgA
MPSNSDWLLIALAASKRGRLTPVQVQKTLFLFGRGAPDHVGKEFYEFQPYDYGPFSETIYRDLGALAESGAIVMEPAPHGRWQVYTITAEGERRGEQAMNELDPKLADYAKRVVDWVTSKSFPDLVRAIYARYPEFKARSVFND